MGDETDDERVSEITALFGATGQGLNWTNEDDGGWTATLIPALASGAPTSHGSPSVTRPTRREAAEAAWAEWGSGTAASRD